MWTELFSPFAQPDLLLFCSPGVLLGPEFRGDSLRTESISSSPSPVLPSTPMPLTTHSKTGSRDSCTQTEKGQETSKPSTPALQSVPGPSRISSPSPVYIPDRIAGTHHKHTYNTPSTWCLSLKFIFTVYVYLCIATSEPSNGQMQRKCFKYIVK